MIGRLLVCALVAAPSLCGADQTVTKMNEILRDMGDLQVQIKTLQKSLDGQFAAVIQKDGEQARAAAEQTSKAIGALGDRLGKSLQDLQEQQNQTLGTVAGLGSQMKGVSSDLSATKESLKELTTAMTRLSTQLSDLTTAVKALQTAKETAAPPEVSAADLISSANADYLGGKMDLAKSEYTEFVSKFPGDAQAPWAQYRIGWIQYSLGAWEEAINAFDLVLKNYPDSKSDAEAMFHKGDSLSKLGRWPDANETFRDLRKRHPNDPLAKRSLTIKPPAAK